MLTIVNHSLVKDRISRLRDKNTNTAEFRRCLKDLGLMLSFKALANASTFTKKIDTPLTIAEGTYLDSSLLKAVAILRAGIGLMDGVTEIIPDIAIGHIGYSRDDKSLLAHHYYTSLPKITSNDHVFVYDPMVATGGSSTSALKLVYDKKPKQVTLICVLCCPEGVKYLLNNYPDLNIVSASQDKGLTEEGFITPGLGDAGDRQFATQN